MVGMLVGSPDYMAPERVCGRPQGPPSTSGRWERRSVRPSAAVPALPFHHPGDVARGPLRGARLSSTAGELGRFWPPCWRRSRRPDRGRGARDGVAPDRVPPMEGTESSETGLVPNQRRNHRNHRKRQRHGNDRRRQRHGRYPRRRRLPRGRRLPGRRGASETSEVGGTAEAPDALGMPETPEPTPPPVPPFHQESPTRALLDVSLIRAAHTAPAGPRTDPRTSFRAGPHTGRHPGARPHTRSNPRPLTPTPTRARPHPEPPPPPAPAPAPSPPPTPALAPEPAPEPSAPPPLPEPPSLATHTTVSRVVVMPPGELPGPAVPSVPRRGRRRRMGLAAAGGVLIGQLLSGSS